MLAADGGYNRNSSPMRTTHDFRRKNNLGYWEHTDICRYCGQNATRNSTSAECPRENTADSATETKLEPSWKDTCRHEWRPLGTDTEQCRHCREARHTPSSPVSEVVPAKPPKPAEPKPVSYTDFQVQKLKRFLSLFVGIIFAAWILVLVIGHEHRTLGGNECHHRHFGLPFQILDGHWHSQSDRCF